MWHLKNRIFFERDVYVRLQALEDHVLVLVKDAIFIVVSKTSYQGIYCVSPSLCVAGTCPVRQSNGDPSKVRVSIGRDPRLSGAALGEVSLEAMKMMRRRN